MSKNEDRLIQYGISNDLAKKYVNLGLNVTKIRAINIDDLEVRFGLSNEEAKALKNNIVRKPIEDEVVQTLLQRNNFVCCLCKGVKGKSYIIHHIEAYEINQNNEYYNLAVLCPNDHDLAHSSGLTLGISIKQILKAKENWELSVEIENASKAARRIDVRVDGIDYINVFRIEDMCLNIFGHIPSTQASEYMRKHGILTKSYRFDRHNVISKISNGRYMFDYPNSYETTHYRTLLLKLSEHIEFMDLSIAVAKGYKATKMLEGSYAYFIGGVNSNRPEMPFGSKTPPVVMHYRTTKISVNWDLDPNYLLSVSAISRMGRKNRYVIYCLVRTVDKSDIKNHFFVVASPLLIAQPSKYPNKTPAIAYQKQYEAESTKTSVDYEDDI